MKLRILGSGTSTGVPEVGCTCPVCTSSDPCDRRLRTSALVYADDGSVILIDCGPDFREQMLRMTSFEKIDGVLITHEHYDHVGGLDDLRPFCRFGEIPIYSDAYTAEHLRARMPYCFVEQKYPGVPRIYLKEVCAGTPFAINQTEILPLCVMHGRLPILAYRIGGRLGYVTDMLTVPDASLQALTGVDVLVMNALYGGTSTSKLFLNVRERLSLCYFASSMLDKLKGVMVVSSGVEFDKLDLAQEEILAQLEAVRRGDFTAQELEAARRAVSSSLRSLPDSQGRLEDYWTTQLLSGRRLEGPDALLAPVEKVGADDVVRAARAVELDTVYRLMGKEER